MRIVTPSNSSPAGGHYSQGVAAGRLLFISGQLPITADGEKVQGSIEEQVLQALKNVKAIAEAGGSDLNHIVKVNAYLANGDDWGAFNKVFGEFFGDHRPARAVVPVPDLHYGFLVEIEAIAEVVR